MNTKKNKTNTKSSTEEVLDDYWRRRAKELGFSVDQLKAACHGSLTVWAETHRKIMGEPFSLEINEVYFEVLYN